MVDANLLDKGAANATEEKQVGLAGHPHRVLRGVGVALSRTAAIELLTSQYINMKLFPFKTTSCDRFQAGILYIREVFLLFSSGKAFPYCTRLRELFRTAQRETVAIFNCTERDKSG